MSSPNPQKGSLEELFRHHLANEAATVPPRPHVWEQLDNRLLLTENTRYRRRLRTYRWALAASLLLASLAGGGWWQSQRGPATAPLASATGRDQFPNARLPSSAGLAAARRAAGLPRLAPQTAAAGSATAPDITFTTKPVASGKTVTSSGASAAAVASARLAPVNDNNIRQRPGFSNLALASRPANPSAQATEARRGLKVAASEPAAALTTDLATESAAALALAPRDAASAAPSATGRRDVSTLASAGGVTNAAPTVASVGSANPASALALSTDYQAASAAADELTELIPAAGQRSAFASAAVAALDARAARLVPTDAAGPLGNLPSSLTAPALPESPPPVVARAWQFGVSYASGLFSPNADFVKDSSRYNPAFGARSAGLTRSAAAEYRAHLRSGLSQRLSFWASRRLGNGRWGLRGGLELSQQTASSATSSAFVGEQVADFGSTIVANRSAVLRGTTFRYRAASVSAEARYGNPAKTGFSLYGRMGALLSALFSARGEVEGNAEATRDYSLMSPSMPYRRLSASVRGGGGLQFRPASHAWALSLGPVAEVGIMSLNTDPQQGFWQQQRPYSFGLEAGLELGRAPKRTLGL